MATKVLAPSDVKIDPVTGLIRVDGIIICKKVIRDGRTFLQFKDGDRIRSNCRKTQYVEIDLDGFSGVVEDIALQE